MAGIPIGLHAPGLYSNHDVHPIPVPKPGGLGYSPDVFVNGREVHRNGDEFVEHTAPLLPPPPPHSDKLADVSNPRILVNGKMIAKQGADLVPGGKVLFGSHSVYM